MRNGPYELIVPPTEYPGKKYRGRYAYEHRVAWWKKTGLNPDDFKQHVIHHKNEKKRDNRSRNVDLMHGYLHRSHHAQKPNIGDFVCPECQKNFQRKLRVVNEHKKRPGYCGPFCSRSCGARYHSAD